MTWESGTPRIPDATIRLDQIPAEGRKLQLEVDAETRNAIVDFLEVSELPRLAIDLEARKFRGGIRVTGRLTAEVVQPCVVTFVPVHQSIDEPVDRIYLPGKEAPPSAQAGSEVFVDLERDDMPDYFDGAEVDLSDLIIESLALALDPYPRAPGVELSDVLPEEPDEDDSPFSALRSLTDPPKT